MFLWQEGDKYSGGTERGISIHISNSKIYNIKQNYKIAEIPLTSQNTIQPTSKAINVLFLWGCLRRSSHLSKHIPPIGDLVQLSIF